MFVYVSEHVVLSERTGRDRTWCVGIAAENSIADHCTSDAAILG